MPVLQNNSGSRINVVDTQYANSATHITPELNQPVGNSALSQGLAAAAGLQNPSLFTKPVSAKLAAEINLKASSLTDSAAKLQVTEQASSLSTVTSGIEAPRQTDAAVARTLVPQAVGQPGWSESVTQKVMWMSSQHINRAEIALDPPELGSLQVRVTTHADQTTVSFTSPHAVVREALDQGAARLREMMEGQGINLADVDVSEEKSEGQQQEEEGVSEPYVIADDIEQPNPDDVMQSAQIPVPKGLVDHYV